MITQVFKHWPKKIWGCFLAFWLYLMSMVYPDPKFFIFNTRKLFCFFESGKYGNFHIESSLWQFFTSYKLNSCRWNYWRRKLFKGGNYSRKYNQTQWHKVKDFYFCFVSIASTSQILEPSPQGLISSNICIS